MRAPSAFSCSMRASLSRHGRCRVPPPNGNVTARPVSRDSRAEPVDLAVPHVRGRSPAAPREDRGEHRGRPTPCARRRTSAEISSCGGEGARHLAAVDRLVQLEPVDRDARPRRRRCPRRRARPCGRCRRRWRVRWPRRARPSRRRAPRRAGPARRRRARAGCGRARRGTRRPSPSPTGSPRAATAPGMPSTPSISPMSQSWRSGGGGREADAAVAHDHGGDAVPDRRREQRVPGDLAVVVGVHVDEAGRDREAGGVELLAPGLVDGADRGDAAVVDGDVGEHRTRRRGRRSRFRSGSPDRARQIPP